MWQYEGDLQHPDRFRVSIHILSTPEYLWKREKGDYDIHQPYYILSLSSSWTEQTAISFQCKDCAQMSFTPTSRNFFHYLFMNALSVT